MSQTWVIKDTAPVDPNEYFPAVSINFTSNNESFTSLGVVDGGSTCELQYNGVTYAGVDLQDPNSGPEYNFEWDNNAYKTLVFDTAPTGELLAWLQKNADKQSDPEYLTLKSELTSVANAIRAKGGTTDPLIYPDGFVAAIQAISSGGEFVIEHGTKVFAEDVVLKNTPLIIQHSVNNSPFLFVGISGKTGSKVAYQVAYTLKTNRIDGYSIPYRTDYDGYIMWGSSNGTYDVNMLYRYNKLITLGTQRVTINNPSGYNNVAFLAGSTLNWYVVGLK